jgi:dephospho-CoA kinase
VTIGLRGGIGAGKSAVARRLAELGAIVIDADALAREVVAPGTEGLAEVVRTFGTAVLTPDGRMDRAAMAQLVFGDPDKLRQLEAIIHPRVRARSAELVADAPPHAVVVHDIPLLAESLTAGSQAPVSQMPGSQMPGSGTAGSGTAGSGTAESQSAESRTAAGFDLVLVVHADEAVRLDRLVRRRGMTEEAARSRFAAQASDQQRRAVADVVIENNGTVEELQAAVDALWHNRIAPLIGQASPDRRGSPGHERAARESR